MDPDCLAGAARESQGALDGGAGRRIRQAPVRRDSLALCLVVVMLSGGCGLFGQSRAPAATYSGPLDVNTASLEDIAQLPGVTPSMARRIYEGRPYATIDELVERGLLSERELDRVRKKIRIRAPKPPPAPAS